MPETYKNLIKAGIKEDYSMGFPEQIGYRAGTGFSFFGMTYILKNRQN